MKGVTLQNNQYRFIANIIDKCNEAGKEDLSPSEIKSLSTQIVKGVAKADGFSEEEKQRCISIVGNVLNKNGTDSSKQIAHALKAEVEQIPYDVTLGEFVDVAYGKDVVYEPGSAGYYIENLAYKEAMEQNSKTRKLARSNAKTRKAVAEEDYEATVAEIKAENGKNQAKTQGEVEAIKSRIRKKKLENKEAKESDDAERDAITRKIEKEAEEQKLARVQAKEREGEINSKIKEDKLAEKAAKAEAKRVQAEKDLENKEKEAELKAQRKAERDQEKADQKAIKDRMKTEKLREDEARQKDRNERAQKNREAFKKVREGAGKVLGGLGKTFVGLVGVPIKITQSLIGVTNLGLNAIGNKISEAQLSMEEKRQIRSEQAKDLLSDTAKAEDVVKKKGGSAELGDAE